MLRPTARSIGVAVCGLVAASLPAGAQDQAPAEARLIVTPERPEIAVGDSVQLTARAVDGSGRPIPDAVIVFTRGIVAQAPVDSNGLVRAGSIGASPVIVTAVIPGAKPLLKHVTVQVVPGPATRVEIGSHPSRLVPGQRVPVGARVLSAEGDTRGDPVRWTSSAPSVARVSPDGLLEAHTPGKATITASAGQLQATAVVEVLRASPASLTIEPPTAKALQGDVVRFAAVARDPAGKAIRGVPITWSFGPGQGQIDPDGAFVGYEPGTYTVTASLGTRSASANVTLARRNVRRPVTVVGAVIRSAFPTAEVWIHPNGKVAYLATATGGDRLYTIDISDPAGPVIVDSVVANTRLINDVMTDPAGKILVFTREGAADRRNGIVICSIEDPLHPRVVSEFTEGVTAGVHSAFVYTQPGHGTHVYLTNDGTGAVHIIDVNDPAHPKGVGRWKTPRADAGRSLHDVDVQDGLLYGSWWHDGLVILDVGNGIRGGSPSNPQVVAQYRYDLDSLYRQVAETGDPAFIRGTHTAWRHQNYVFVADEVFGRPSGERFSLARPAQAYGRLHVLDVSDIAHPKPVAWYEPEYGGVHNVWVVGDTLYMGAYNAGFRAFDISGELRGDLRAQGREMAQLSTGDPGGLLPNATMTWGVVVKNGLAYVNDFNSGLFIVRLEPRGEEPGPLVP